MRVVYIGEFLLDLSPSRRIMFIERLLIRLQNIMFSCGVNFPGNALLVLVCEDSFIHVYAVPTQCKCELRHLYGTSAGRKHRCTR